jgi:hypothetical protein
MQKVPVCQVMHSQYEHRGVVNSRLTLVLCKHKLLCGKTPIAGLSTPY